MYSGFSAATARPSAVVRPAATGASNAAPRTGRLATMRSTIAAPSKADQNRRRVHFARDIARRSAS
jgi:hypothetical protein